MVKTIRGGNMKKTKLGFALLFSMLLVITGCSSKKDDGVKTPTAGEPVTIKYWQHSSPARDEMVKTIIADFEKKHENIKVVLEFVPEDDYNQKLITALGSGTAPDVFQVQSGTVPKLVKADSILPLDSSIMSKDYMEKEFIPATVGALKIDGEYYGVPTDTQTIISFWNKALYTEAGLDPEKGPQSWEELFENARKLTKRDGDLMTQSGWGTKGYAPELQAYVEQKGGKFFDEKTEKFVFADDKKSVDAIKEMASLYRDDKVYSEDFSKNWAGFRQGIISQMLGHPAIIGNLKETAPNVDLGVGLIPSEDGKNLTVITSWAYVMSKNANATAATELINFMSSEEVQKEWTKQTGELPSRVSLIDDAELMKDAKTEVALSSLKNATVGRLQTRPLYSIWSDHYQRIMHTEEDIETILKDAQEALNEEYGKQL